MLLTMFFCTVYTVFISNTLCIFLYKYLFFSQCMGTCTQWRRVAGGGGRGGGGCSLVWESGGKLMGQIQHLILQSRKRDRATDKLREKGVGEKEVFYYGKKAEQVGRIMSCLQRVWGAQMVIGKVFLGLFVSWLFSGVSVTRKVENFKARHCALLREIFLTKEQSSSILDKMSGKIR